MQDKTNTTVKLLQHRLPFVNDKSTRNIEHLSTTTVATLLLILFLLRTGPEGEVRKLTRRTKDPLSNRKWLLGEHFDISDTDNAE